MTLIQLFLIHRYHAGSVHYVTPTEDNLSQTQRMKDLGIFTVVRSEIGQIIVADVDRAARRRALAPRRRAARGTDQEADPSTGVTLGRIDRAPDRTSRPAVCPRAQGRATRRTRRPTADNAIPVLVATANVPDHERAMVPERRPARGPTVRVPGRQRGSGPRRLRRQRGDRDLPDHPRVPDGRALRRLVRGAPAEPVGERAGRRRDAVRGGRRWRPARRAAEGRARDDVHRVAGTAADDPQHVQDRRRADTGGDPCRRPDGRDPCSVDLRRPQRRDARADDRLGDARGRLGPGGARLRARGPCGDAARAGAVPPLLRRLPHLARDQQDRRARRRRHPRAGPRR